MADDTPSVDYFRDFYALESPTESLAEARAEWDRMIAQVRAETLREAADATRAEAPKEPYAGATFGTYADWLDERADRIEKEAGQ